jgi:hypothetical protein
VKLAGVLAGEGRGKGLGPTGTRFGRSAGAVVAPASRHAGSQGRRPPRLLFPVSWGSVGPVDGSACYGRGRGGWREALLGLQLARNRSSPRPGARRSAGGAVGVGGGALRVGVKEQRRLYSEVRAGARERGSAGRARTTGQLRTASGRGGRTAAQRSTASARARRG